MYDGNFVFKVIFSKLSIEYDVKTQLKSLKWNQLELAERVNGIFILSDYVVYDRTECKLNGNWTNKARLLS